MNRIGPIETLRDLANDTVSPLYRLAGQQILVRDGRGRLQFARFAYQVVRRGAAVLAHYLNLGTPMAARVTVYAQLLQHFARCGARTASAVSATAFRASLDRARWTLRFAPL